MLKYCLKKKEGEGGGKEGREAGREGGLELGDPRL
jgi:hypothetical protein